MKKLSRDQMKNLNGGLLAPGPGDGCCWHNSSWGVYTCGLPMGAAKDWQQQLGGNWCCATCVTSYNQS